MRKTMLFIALLTAGLVAPAAAGPITLKGDSAQSTSGLCDYTGTLEYSASGATTATLTVTLTNTTNPGTGGYLTAFVLNNPGNAITGITSVTSAYNDFEILGGPSFSNGVGGSPFGQFDLGAGLGGSFEGGGSPAAGIGVGDTGEFVFALTGTNLDTLTSASFINELSTGPGDGEGHQFFVARFKGLTETDSPNAPTSDKVPAQANPEPATLLLAVMGIGLLGPIVRRKREG